MLLERLPDRYLTIAEVAKVLSAGDKPVHRRRVYAWIAEGVRAPDGSVIKLRSIRLPKGQAVHPDDLRAFVAGLNGEQPVRPAISMPRLVQHAAPIRRTPAHLLGTYPEDRQLSGVPRPAASAQSRGPVRQTGPRLA